MIHQEVHLLTTRSLSFVMLILGLGTATLGHAEDTKVGTEAQSLKVGGEFRTELNRNDQGLTKTKDNSPDAVTELQIQTAKLKFSGNFNKDTEYKFRFNLFNPTTTPLDYGYGVHWFSDVVGLGVGKMKVMQGGWDTIDDSFRDHWAGAYAENRAFAKYAEMIALQVKVAGQINVQILNDVTTKDKGEWNKTSHPTFAMGWLGNLGIVSPVVDLGSYDNNKSRWTDFGIKTGVAGIKARLDLRDEVKSHKGADSAGKAKSQDDKGQAVTLLLAYDIKDVAMPWLYYSTYEKKEFEDSKAGKKDVKVNTVDTDKVTGKKTYKFDDNAQVFGVGADLGMMGKGWTPYLALLSKSGKFADDTTGKEEKKTENQVRLGVLGDF